MSIQTGLIAELKHESSLTKKVLERVPFEKADWKPHEKSMNLARLASHIAELPRWITEILAVDEFDFIVNNFKRSKPQSHEELMNDFNEALVSAIASLENTTLEEFDKTWALKRSGQIIFQLPKKVAIRTLALSHVYHHRGQLTVYLRLLNIPVPSIYGPSADENF
jgi:uncharacterized damage-inducible protein DinB